MDKRLIKKYNIIDMRNLALKKGGKCLSTEYKGIHTKIKWECDKHHRWKATPGSIKRGTWCLICAGKAHGTLKEMQELAKKREGLCLSDKYINSHTKLKWQCKENHKWKNTPAHIKFGQWCPCCSKFLSERICRKFFEEIFHEKFSKKRYDWLLSPKGKKLELDGYNKKLKLAFEYCGEQHYKSTGYTKYQDIFNYLKQCDQIKKDKCKELGITLIEVPYKVKYKDMEKYILDQTKTDIPFKNLNYKKWNMYSLDILKELQEIAKLKGGQCISDFYLCDSSKLEWKCKYCHIWHATSHVIKAGHWCPECVGLKRCTIEEMRKLAISKGGKCLSDIYNGDKGKLKWKCNKNHIFFMKPNCIKNGQWCKICGIKRRSENIRNKKLNLIMNFT